MDRRSQLRRTGPPPRRTELASVTPLSPESRKRRQERRERRRVARLKYGPNPMCEFPGCIAEADDVHEPLTRARGGSITDPANFLAVCRHHHDWLHDHPAEAAELGLLLPSWWPDGGGAA